MATIKIDDGLMNSIKDIVKKTKLYVNEDDFIQQAIMKQIVKFKNI
jgi:hypothetical protein